MKRIVSILGKNAKYSIIAVMASAIIMIVALMVQPLIGMADNGDFYRSINGQGIYKIDRYQDDQFFQYFSSKYGVYQYFNEGEKSLLSVHNVYIQAAKILDSIFTSDKDVFDIRFLSAIYIVQLLIGIYLLVDYITWKKPVIQKILLTTTCVLMFADTAYTAYFNSFYAEGIVYITFLTLTACALLLTQKRHSSYLLLALLVINGVILIFTKQQNATAGVVLLLLCLLIGFGFSIEKSKFKKVAVVSSLVMAVSGILIYLSISDDFLAINQYHAMTRGAMMTGENPEKTLEQFGIDKQYAILDGSIYYERYPIVEVESEELKEEFYNKYGLIPLSVYYLTHPNELMTILDTAAREGYKIRPQMQGNFERSAGREPGEQTNFFTLYSSFKVRSIPSTVGFAIIWILLVCILCLKDVRKLMVVICTILMGLIQVATSIVGAGDADLSKHIFLYNVAFDLVSFICIGPLIVRGIDQVISALKSVMHKKKVIALFLGVLLLSAASEEMTLAAETDGEKVPSQSTIIIYKQGEDVQFLEELAKACEMETHLVEEQQYNEMYLEGVEYAITTSSVPMQDLRDKKIKTLCLGENFIDAPGITFRTYFRKTTEFLHDSYRDREWFEEKMIGIDTAKGNKFGEIKVGGEASIPFAAMGEDQNYYVPYYQKERISIILLGEVLNKILNNDGKGNMYFVLDEIYVFSDLEKLRSWADTLSANGIPFLMRIMPVYENLTYPAFVRYAQTLRYMQSRGGTVVIHEPLVMERESEREPLEEKMKRFYTALEKEKIQYQELEKTPYFFEFESISYIKGNEKYVQNLPFNSMFGMNAADRDETFVELIEKVNDTWLSFHDYREEFTDAIYLYYEEETTGEFEYREKEEAAFALFFSASDRILLVVVGCSLAVFTLLLWIGRRWYRRKFYR